MQSFYIKQDTFYVTFSPQILKMISWLHKLIIDRCKIQIPHCTRTNDHMADNQIVLSYQTATLFMYTYSTVCTLYSEYIPSLYLELCSCH